MSEQATTLMVFFNLKPGTNEADYLAWARGSRFAHREPAQQRHFVRGVQGAEDAGQQSASPCDYFEVIRIASETQFLQESQSAQMQQVIRQFETFATDAQFICTRDITTL